MPHTVKVQPSPSARTSLPHIERGVDKDHEMVLPEHIVHPWTLKLSRPDTRIEMCQWELAHPGMVNIAAILPKREGNKDQNHDDVTLIDGEVVDIDDLEQFGRDLLDLIAIVRREHPEFAARSVGRVSPRPTRKRSA